MKIGILGSGQVGLTLARGFLEAGHQVMVGTREPESEKLTIWRADNQDVQIGTLEQTAQFGEILVIATKWNGTQNALNLSGIDNFSGKTVIDVTNPLKTVDGVIQLEIGFDNSGGELIQSWVPKAHVVKTLNLIGHQFMVQPRLKLSKGTPDMFLCGNQEPAKQTVTDLLGQLGWDKITDLGGIENSRLMEPLCIVWVKYAQIHGTWDIAWSMLSSKEQVNG
jgi:8-hydroxy-5-deazaflavin:NADPH oxidoreductase